jgi:Uma2 family endonuclease
MSIFSKREAVVVCDPDEALAPYDVPDLELLGPTRSQRWLNQRLWSEREYLALEIQSRMEYSQGRIRVLPSVTCLHQVVLMAALAQLNDFTKCRQLGRALFLGIRVKLAEGEFREPDIVFLKKEHFQGRHDEYWEGVDLVMEVLLDDARSRPRDEVTKRREYASAGIPEYWIIDPRDKRITVLALAGKVYRVHGEFKPGSVANSVLLPGFTLGVDAVLNAD